MQRIDNKVVGISQEINNLITTWYCPPNPPIDTLYRFKNCLQLIDGGNKESIILGDINCDLLSENLSSQASELKFITRLYQYKQLISEPTRVTENTRTLIDHFYTTNPQNIISKGVSVVSISDHYLIYGTRKFKTNKENDKIIEYRDYKRFNEQIFLHDLKNCFSNFGLDNQCNPNISWQIWKNNFFQIWDKHAPVKRRKVGAKGLPWLTSDLTYKKRQVNFLSKIPRSSISSDSFLTDVYYPDTGLFNSQEIRPQYTSKENCNLWNEWNPHTACLSHICQIGHSTVV